MRLTLLGVIDSYKLLQVKRPANLTLTFENAPTNITESVVLMEGERNVSQGGVVCLSICLLVFWAPVLWCVGEADTDTVSPRLAEPGPAADSRFYLMWTSRVGFQRWLQHMISIMTRGGTHAGG